MSDQIGTVIWISGPVVRARFVERDGTFAAPRLFDRRFTRELVRSHPREAVAAAWQDNLEKVVVRYGRKLIVNDARPRTERPGSDRRPGFGGGGGDRRGFSRF